MDSDEDAFPTDGSEDEDDFDYEEASDSDPEPVVDMESDPDVDDEAPEILEPKDLLSAQFAAIEEVNSIFQIPAATARHLLAHFNWNKERLTERYFSGDHEALYREAHCIDPNLAKHTTGDDLECEVCMDDITEAESTQLPCGHPFCKVCWKSYLEERILGQGTSNITCMEHGCDVKIDEYTVSKLLKDSPAALERYHYLVAKAFVRDNKNIKWCPAAGCKYALRLPFAEARNVKCKCGFTFCFGCGQSKHDPLKCVMLAKWLKKCEDDSETSNWLATNTKECPKCKATIEKNGGCNHMTCNSCRYEFCWQCMGSWEPHGSSWYQCNRFDEEESKKAQEELKSSRASLARYLFYFNRYINHDQSMKFENKLWEVVEAKQRHMQQLDMSWIEVQFLNQAVTALQDARAVLKYTYVFAFYLKKTNQCAIFEDNQRDLEMSVEKLSGCLEGDLDVSDIPTLRQTVMNLAKYCGKRKEVLLEHVLEGYARNLWEYNSPDISAAMEAAM